MVYLILQFQLGYEENGEIISGIIFDPIKNEMFFAEKGQWCLFK